MNENNNLLTPEEVSNYLNVSMSTVYRYLNDTVAPLPSFKITKKGIRIKQSDLDNWITEQTEIERQQMRDDHIRGDDLEEL